MRQLSCWWKESNKRLAAASRTAAGSCAGSPIRLEPSRSPGGVSILNVSQLAIVHGTLVSELVISLKQKEAAGSVGDVDASTAGDWKSGYFRFGLEKRTLMCC